MIIRSKIYFKGLTILKVDRSWIIYKFKKKLYHIIRSIYLKMFVLGEKSRYKKVKIIV